MPRFTVIRASAGSGKTFSLTQEYLRLLLTGKDAFRHIMAVTFTNKATEEMKTRIIRELYLLSSHKPTNQLNGLISATRLTEEQIRERSARILKQLLHQYSWFSVNTIDSFFQRIIRNFTRELGIQEGYVIELDTEPVLTEVIDRLLVNAEHDRTLLAWLSMFAESLIEKGENWNLKRSMRELGREIFREEFKNLSEQSVSLLSDRNFMNDYRSRLFALQRKIENAYRVFGTRAMDIIKSHGLSVDDFSRKSGGPAGFLSKTAEGEFKGPSDAVFEAATRKEKWYTQASPLKKTIEDVAVRELMPLLQSTKVYYDANSVFCNTASVILKNLFTLGILIDLSRLSDSWCSENNTFLLPEAPVFLNRIIDDNDAPFIYEKAGCWYHHFMIDEFQDTSVMQWNNFKPLISNSLSQNYDNLAVGDIKQSIYRWRNSNWEILENRIGQDFLSGVINPVTLSENWRSRENIVRFNNEFFSKAASVLQDDFENTLIRHNVQGDYGIQSLNTLYRDMHQQPLREDRDGGYVNVRFFSNGDDTDFYDTVNHTIIKQIYVLLDHGYQLKDIAILTRKNSEAAQLADFLLKYTEEGREPLKVISDEALRLGSSIILNTLMSLLKHIADPADRNNNYYLTAVCSNYVYDGKPEEEWINPPYTRDNRSGPNLPDEFRELALGARSYSLVELAERLIRIFRLDSYGGEQVYLMAFRDLILEYTRNHSSDITRFIEFWEDTGSERSVAAPAGQDAVRILTLHKSKGLEFKVTIIAYCTWELNTFNKSFLWCRPDAEPFNRLPLIPIAFTKKLKETIFAKEYHEELHKQLVDNLNLMYVAFTRAREAMFVFCREKKDDRLGTASALAGRILGNKNFESGSLPPAVRDPDSRACETIGYRPSKSGSLATRLKIAFQGNLLFDPEVNKPARPINDGRIMHEIFTMIRTREDIKDAVGNMHLQGKVTTGEQERYIRLIENAMNDLQVSTWFAGDWNILNEAEIIVPGGEIRRPDRVMMRGRQTLVIDYKFGSRTDKGYESQVKEYAGLMKTMGYEGVEGYLWYVRLGRVVQVKL